MDTISKQALTKQTAARTASPPQWLGAWSPASTSPVTKEVAQTALGQAQAALYGSSPMEAGKRLDRCLAHYELPGNWNELVDGHARVDDYISSLCKLPPDLLDRALTHVVETYPFRFPKIATIMKAVEGEMSERVALVKRLEMVCSISRWPAPPREPPTAEQKAKVGKLMEEFRAGLSA